MTGKRGQRGRKDLLAGNPCHGCGCFAQFYAKDFGWKVRTRGDSSREFDDTTGAVSRSWITAGQPSTAAHTPQRSGEEVANLSRVRSTIRSGDVIYAASLDRTKRNL